MKELFVSRIEGEILSGDFEVGSVLPSERILAEKMGVSRSVISVGLAELAEKGFVEIRPRSGTVVMDYRRHGTLETLVSIMKYNGDRLRREDIRSIIELGKALESVMLRDLIPIVTDEDVRELKALLERIVSCIDSGDTGLVVQCLFDFQHMLMFKSGNTMLPLIYHSFQLPITSLWARYIRHYGAAALCEVNERMLCYIEARDLAGALGWSQSAMSQTIEGDREIYAD